MGGLLDPIEGGDGNPLVTYVAINGIWAEPMDAGGGVECTIEVLRHGDLLPQGQGRLPDSLHKGGVAIVGAQAGPVVVGAVEDLLSSVVGESSGHIHPVGPQGLGLLQIGRLVEAGGPGGEPVLPDLRRRGDQAQVNGDIGFLHQSGDKREIFLRALALHHLGDQPITAEVDTAKFPLAQDILVTGFQADPAVPQGELVL